MTELFELPKTRKERCKRNGRQEYRGVRFAPFHPVLGRGAVLSRSWAGLSRQLGQMRSQCRLKRAAIELVTVQATEDDGDTWRPATPDEMLSFLNSQQANVR